MFLSTLLFRLGKSLVTMQWREFSCQSSGADPGFLKGGGGGPDPLDPPPDPPMIIELKIRGGGPPDPTIPPIFYSITLL